MDTTLYTEFAGTGGWSTNDYDIAVSMAVKDAKRDGRLFSEIYDKTTNMVIGYATYDGKEC